jgi:putative MATE family efflux protein
MLSGSIVKGLLSISLPIMITNVGQSLFNIVDMNILKTYSTDGFAVGAVGACGTLTTLITGLMVGISAGANVIIAKYIGSGDQKRVSRAVGTAILFALLGGIALALIGVLCAETFLIWVNCPAQLLQKAVLYFRLYFAGMPILMVYNFSAAILRASGDSKRPMVYLTLGGVIKVTFNLLFVAGLHMTVDGVAYATLISWVLSAGLAVAALFKTKTVIRLSPGQIRFYPQELKEMLIIGIPSGLQQALYSVANVIISATVNTFGPEATTGISIANNFDGVLYQLCVATSLAVMPYVSQNIGARNISRATRSILIGVGITAVFGTTFGSLSALFSGKLSSIMSSDPAVIAYSQ